MLHARWPYILRMFLRITCALKTNLRVRFEHPRPLPRSFCWFHTWTRLPFQLTVASHRLLRLRRRWISCSEVGALSSRKGVSWPAFTCRRGKKHPVRSEVSIYVQRSTCLTTAGGKKTDMQASVETARCTRSFVQDVAFDLCVGQKYKNTLREDLRIA